MGVDAGVAVAVAVALAVWACQLAPGSGRSGPGRSRAPPLRPGALSGRSAAGAHLSLADLALLEEHRHAAARVDLREVLSLPSVPSWLVQRK